MRHYKGYVLDAFQREALAGIRAGENVIVAAPTGCGKTLIAEYAIERALDGGTRIIYTAPIKALSNQKFRDFETLHGERVGIMTGDVTINPTADALIMTTEIFRNTIFDNPARLAGIRYVILDEAHYLDDPDRGTVWEESIIFAPPAIRFIALSATISNLDEFAAWMRKVREGGVRVVLETRRPVPLHPFVFTGEEVFDLRDVRGRGFPRPKEARFGRERDERRKRGGRDGREARLPFSEANRRLIDVIEEREHLPCIFFLFSRDACERMAEKSASRDLVSADERARLDHHLAELAREFELESDPEMARLSKLLRRGIAFHHAGMLPTLKEVVERLFTSGLIKLLFATETFSLGINMPARAVAFESLKKFDGVKRDYMKTREFLQMAGRAGRRGIDTEGFVYACVQPSTERPSEVRAVMLGDVEEVESQFYLSYATLLSLYSHLGEAIYEACEKSFVHFRHKRKKGGGPFQDVLSQVRRRIRLLQEMGYLEGQRLTKKGRFASLVYGYEIQTAELFAGGMLAELDPVELCVVLAAVVYEAKRDTWYVPLRRDILQPLAGRAKALLEPFREGELRLGLAETKRPDWNLSRAVYEWARGAPFEQLAEYTDVSPGDLIRVFRLSIQLIRQLGKPLRFLGLGPEEERSWRRLLRDATSCLKRDVVDAERQLRQAVKVEGGEEALAHVPPEEAIETAEGEPDLSNVLARHEPAGEDAAVEIFFEEEAAEPPAEAPAASERAAEEARARPRPVDFGWLPPGEEEQGSIEAEGRESRRGRAPAGDAAPAPSWHDVRPGAPGPGRRRGARGFVMKRGAARGRGGRGRRGGRGGR
jgi:superfamily II RNA helicase